MNIMNLLQDTLEDVNLEGDKLKETNLAAAINEVFTTKPSVTLAEDIEFEQLMSGFDIIIQELERNNQAMALVNQLDANTNIDEFNSSVSLLGNMLGFDPREDGATADMVVEKAKKLAVKTKAKIKEAFKRIVTAISFFFKRLFGSIPAKIKWITENGQKITERQHKNPKLRYSGPATRFLEIKGKSYFALKPTVIRNVGEDLLAGSMQLKKVTDQLVALASETEVSGAKAHAILVNNGFKYEGEPARPDAESGFVPSSSHGIVHKMAITGFPFRTEVISSSKGIIQGINRFLIENVERVDIDRLPGKTLTQATEIYRKALDLEKLDSSKAFEAAADKEGVDTANIVKLAKSHSKLMMTFSKMMVGHADGVVSLYT